MATKTARTRTTPTAPLGHGKWEATLKMIRPLKARVRALELRLRAIERLLKG